MALGQLKHGTYKISTDTVEFGGAKNFSELSINQDKTFTYKYLTTMSCFLWYDCQGKWEVRNGNLILTDSVYSFHPVVDFTRNRQTDNGRISISVTTKKGEPIAGIKILYLFENSKDTLAGHTNLRGEFVINTANKSSNPKTKLIDDVEIWVVYFDKKQQDWTTNNFSSLSAEMECVIDDNAVDELVLRTTTYKIKNSDLIFTSRTFSKKDPRPNQQIFGNFRFEKE